VVSDDVVARVVTEVGDASVFDGGRRVPCPRDFSPRNWMVRDGRFGLIDFEHAAPDIRWVDFSKLAEDAWRDRAAMRAFVDAYGRPWSELDGARFRCLIWLQALSTWVWSVAHGDAAYEAQARDLYGRLHERRDLRGPPTRWRMRRRRSLRPPDARDWDASPMAAAERRGTSDRFVLRFVKPATPAGG
jgi:Ser/Thr protein kinase RdoA (MazF antagonist)